MLASLIVRRCSSCGKVLKGAKPMACPACGGDQWEAVSNVIVKGAASAPAYGGGT